MRFGEYKGGAKLSFKRRAQTSSKECELSLKLGELAKDHVKDILKGDELIKGSFI